MFIELQLTDIFDKNNIYYQKMIDIINNPNPLNEKYTEKHHIIPRFVYKDLNSEIDNSENNIVILSIKNHILIHYYAAKCCFEQYKWKCLNAVLRTLGNIKLNKFENKLDEIAEEIADIKKELRLTKMPVNIRKKCSYNRYIFSEEERKEKYGKQSICNQYRKGTKLSDETKKLISKNRKGKCKGHNVSDKTKKLISEKAKKRASEGGGCGFIQTNEIIEKRKKSVSIARAVVLKEYKEYIKNNKISWNEFQIFFKEKLLKLYNEYNANKPDAEKLNFKTFKRYYYENSRS